MHKKYSCSELEMEETWRSCIKDQSKYIITYPEDFISPIDLSQYSELLNNLKTRY